MSTIRTWWRAGHPLVSRWTHTDAGDLTWVGRAANRYYSLTRWLRPSWWLYVFAPYNSHWCWKARKPAAFRKVSRSQRPTWNPLDKISIWWPRVFWCRATGHRGIVFYNPGGMEPNNNCRGCGEEIA